MIVFMVGGQVRSIHKIAGGPYEDRSLLWPPKDGDIFAYRVRISPPLAVGSVPVASIWHRISFMQNTQNWGGTVQGANGVFNRRLTDADLQVIQAFLTGQLLEPVEDTAVVRESTDRQASLFRYFASAIERKVEQLLPTIGLEVQKRSMPTDVGNIDFLCRHSAADYPVIVMLKKGQAPKNSLIEVLQRMSWLRQSQPPPRDLRGVIVTEAADQTLRSVVAEVPSVTIRYYRLTVEFVP